MKTNHLRTQNPSNLIAIKRTILLLSFIGVICGFNANAQSSNQKSIEYKSLSPDYDHYQTLGALSGQSTKNNIDRIQFPLKDFQHSAYLKMRTVYIHVPANTFNVKRFPANSSAQTKAELRFLKMLQTKRSAKDVAITDSMAVTYYDPLTTNPFDKDYDRNIKSLFFVGRNLGPWFNPEKLPVTSKVLQNVIQDATFYFFSIKVKFDRARPYQLDTTLKNLEAPGHASYPSGHSSASYVHAYLLARIFPELRDQFMGNAYDMAFSREIRGVHYPSDSQAGKEFARQFVEQLFKSKSFLKDYAAMKAELKKARGGKV